MRRGVEYFRPTISRQIMDSLVYIFVETNNPLKVLKSCQYLDLTYKSITTLSFFFIAVLMVIFIIVLLLSLIVVTTVLVLRHILNS